MLEGSRWRRGDPKLKKRRAFELFMTGVVVFDVVGFELAHLPVWQFLPLWLGMIVEVEASARFLTWLSKHVHLTIPHAPAH